MSEQQKEQTAEERRAICLTCPQFRNEFIKRCGVCGCVIAVLTKFKGRCPHKKW